MMKLTPAIEALRQGATQRSVVRSAMAAAVAHFGRKSSEQVVPARARRKSGIGQVHEALRSPSADPHRRPECLLERARSGGGKQLLSFGPELADRLRHAGKEVIVIAGVPDSGVDVPWASAMRQRFGRPPIALRCAKAAVPLKRVVIVDVSPEFCRAGQHICSSATPTIPALRAGHFVPPIRN